MSEELLKIATNNNNNELLICSLCNSNLKNPLVLNCYHIFCCDCIKSNCKLNSQLFTCPKCFTDNMCSNGVENTFKPSNLYSFLVKSSMTSNHQHEEIEQEQDGICIECPGSQMATSKDNNNNNNNEQNNKPVLVKLSLCYHCKHNLCLTCRTKHYLKQQDETVLELNTLHEGSSNLVNISERLNDVRELKIHEYTKLKEEIKKKHLDLVKCLQIEEKSLLDKLESQIDMEQKKLNHSNMEQKRLLANKQMTKSIRDKILNEKNYKLLSDLCNEFQLAQSEWRLQLKSDAEFNDPNKETVNKYIYMK